MTSVTVQPQSISRQAPPEVRRNRWLLFWSQAVFMFAAGLLDVKTLLPAFVSRYSASLLLVALLPALGSGCKLLPQLFAAHVMRPHAHKKPWLLAADLARILPIAGLAWMLFVRPRAAGPAVLPVCYFALILFTVANGVGAIAWWDILGKTVPRSDRPGLFGGMMLGGSAMGLAAGALVEALLKSSRGPFSHDFALLFALAVGALAVTFVVDAGLVEPAGSAAPIPDTRHDSLVRLVRLLRDGGPFARLMQAQFLLGVPGLAAGLYTPYALGELRLPLDAMGLLVAATAAGSGVGGIFLPGLSRRRGSRSVLAVAASAVVLAPLVVAAAGALRGFLGLRAACCAISFGCQGLATSGLFVGMNDLVLALAPADDRPLYVSLSNSVSGLLVPLPLLGGVLAQRFGSAAVLWLCPLPAVVGLLRLRALRAPGVGAGPG